MPAIIDVFAADGAHDGLPIAIGVPFAAGSVPDAKTITVTSPSGQPLPAGGRPLATWEDGSVRWILVNFAATERGPHTVSTTGSPETTSISPAPNNPVKLARRGDRLTLSNGLVEVELSETGLGPIHRITANGHAYIDRPEDIRFVVDIADTTREPNPRKVTIIEESSVRARVRLEGAHFDPLKRRKFSYRLDVELWSNWPSLRLDYHFFNLEVGQDTVDVDRMAAECNFNLGRQTHRHFHQNYHTVLFHPRQVYNPAPVSLVADSARGQVHVEHEHMLLDTEAYNFHVRPPLIETQDWLGIGDGNRSVYVKMQDFAAMRPKRLASSGSFLEVEFWPRSAGRMQMPQGRSRRQVITLTFAEQPHLTSAEAAQRLNAPLWEGRACVSPAWLAERGEFNMDRTFLAHRKAGHVRMEKFLRRTVQLVTPQAWFDLGDTPDSGYLPTYIALGVSQNLKPGAPQMERVFTAGTHNPLVQWQIPDFYEPVWTNNEYDIIHTLAVEVMRTGRNDHWTMLRWFARHNLEVDFIHLSDHSQQHRATPQHSAGHNRSGAILSHFWCQGLLEYYCFTGDVDALEVAEALGDKIIENLSDPRMREGFWGFTRELGWPTISLSHLADITGKEKYRRQCREIVDFFVRYDRTKHGGALKLSSGDERHSLEWQMIGSFFAYASMFEGVEHFARKTGDAKTKQWMIELLTRIRENLDETHREGTPTFIAGMLPHGMAIGYELTGDERFLRSGMICLEELQDWEWFYDIPPQVKPVAMTHRAVIRFLHHAKQKGLLDGLEYPSARGLKVRDSVVT